MSDKPASGTMVYWRGKGSLEWRFGYVTYIERSYDLVRMGFWSGDSTNGPVVSINEIEWRKY